MFSSQVTDVESSAESKNVFRFQFQGGSLSKTTGTAPGPFLQVLKISILAILTTSQYEVWNLLDVKIAFKKLI